MPQATPITEFDLVFFFFLYSSLFPAIPELGLGPLAVTHVVAVASGYWLVLAPLTLSRSLLPMPASVPFYTNSIHFFLRH